MKIFTLIILFCFSAEAFEWRIISKKDNFLLVNNFGKKFSIESVGGVPKFVKQIKLNANVLLVVYNSGTAGTSQPIQIHRALVFNKKKLIGDFPYKYIPSPGTTYKPEQPKWALKEGKLIVVDSEEDKTVELSL